MRAGSLPGRQPHDLAALRALPDMARDIIPDGDHREFVVTVRTEGGSEIYRATLTLKGEWRDGSSTVSNTV